MGAALWGEGFSAVWQDSAVDTLKRSGSDGGSGLSWVGEAVRR